MPNTLKDGTQVDQVIFNELDLAETNPPAVSEKIAVPALYTGRLKVVMVAYDAVSIHGQELQTGQSETTELDPYVGIEYLDKNGSTITEKESYATIPKGDYTAGKYLCEFSIPQRFLKDIENGNKVSHIKIKLNYDKATSTGKVNAYLIWI